MRNADTAATDANLTEPVPDEKFVRHSDGNVETRLEGLRIRGFLVPNDRFYVRSHAPTPQIDADAWSMRVFGTGVERELQVTYDDLLDLPVVSVVRALACAGNGRAYFDEDQHKPTGGDQWRNGAVGVAEWTGVPLSAVLELADVLPEARDVMPEGLDEARARRPMPLEKAMADDTILAYAMNGEVLPPDHGYPVRLIVSDWIGAASIKWVGSIEVAAEELFSPWNTTDYVLSGPTYPSAGPAEGEPLTTLPVSSALELPWPARLPLGRHVLRGRAWSGAGRIAAVDVSTDGGQFWDPATLREPNMPGAWVRFDFSFSADDLGPAEVRIRARDESGAVQPPDVPFNEGGYLYNAVVAHPIEVVAD